MALQLPGCQESKIIEIFKKASSSVWSGMRNKYTNVLAAKDGGEKYDSEDEARRLLKEINLAIEQVQESQFYAKLTEQIASDEFQNQLKNLLGSHSKLNMVIYALRSLVYHFGCHHQLAIALLLKRDCSWIEQIQVFNPKFVPADVIVLQELGCHVLKFDERCRRKVEEPTLVYMPYPDYFLLGNLLEANWCTSQINQLIVLTNRMKKRSKFSLVDEYIKAIENCTKEMVIETYGRSYDNIMYNFAWHFFEVDSQMDMETLFEGEFSKKSRLMRRRYERHNHPPDIVEEEKLIEEIFTRPFVRGTASEEEEEDDWVWSDHFATYRGPRKYRCRSDPPPKGWIKLNIRGIGAHGDIPAGYGGICHDESMKPVLSYNGFLDVNVDESAACIEALKYGLIELLKKHECRNLIVEGDNFKVIQWANKLHETHKPPEEVGRSLEEVFDLLKKFNSVVYHIYEEANSKANNLAKKGALSGRKKDTLLGKLFKLANKHHEAQETNT